SGRTVRGPANGAEFGAATTSGAGALELAAAGRPGLDGELPGQPTRLPKPDRPRQRRADDAVGQRAGVLWLSAGVGERGDAACAPCGRGPRFHAGPRAGPPGERQAEWGSAGAGAVPAGELGRDVAREGGRDLPRIVEYQTGGKLPGPVYPRTCQAPGGWQGLRAA